MAVRCYLFVPGDKPAMVAKAPRRGAGAVIVDLEDAVAPAVRPAAIGSVAEWIAGLDDPGCEVWVRIPGDDPAGELAALVTPGLRGVVLPKARRAAHVERVAALLGETERTCGAAAGSMGLIVIVETAAAVVDVEAIAAVPRVERLMSGEIDLSAELGIAAGEQAAWTAIRSRIVIAGAASGLAGPIGPVNPDFSDPEALAAEARLLRRHGFRAGAAIHPVQIAPYLEAYTPNREEIAAARRVVALYEAAVGEGRGVVVDDRGRMVDEAAVKIARRLLDEA
ncbi:MAG: HpcH/HpaI aldolase/citrate lyase family protein [Acidimicrobiia bacterium]